MKPIVLFRLRLVVIALCGTIVAILLQEYNSSLLDPIAENRFGLIYTADEPSYLVPAENWVNTGTWKDNSVGNSSYFQRPPGYGLIYSCFYYMLKDRALAGLKVLHILAFLGSIIYVGLILRRFVKSERLVLIAVSAYALLPVFHGFMYYPLTEGLTPLLTLLLIYQLTEEPQTDRFSWMIMQLTSILILMRPQLIIISLLFVAWSLLKGYRFRTASLVLGFLPFLFWSLRTYSIEGEWKGLHPIYSSSNLSQYRPKHEKLTDLFRIWESDGERFHKVVALTSSINIDLDQPLELVPDEFKKSTLTVLTQYRALIHDPDFGKTKEFLDKEQRFIERTDSLRQMLIKENRLRYHIVTPFKSAVYLLSKSQLNLFVFQREWRGNLIIELLRVGCILLINISLLTMLIYILTGNHAEWKLIAISFLLYFLYLVYFQRMNEERYLTPWLPVLFIFVILQFDTLRNYLRSRRDSDRGSIHLP